MNDKAPLAEGRGGTRAHRFKRWWLRLENRLAIGFIALAVIVVFWPRKEPEPIYDDMPLRYWIEESNSSNPIKHDHAMEALRAIGDHGIPKLIRQLEVRPFLSERVYRQLNSNLPKTLVGHLPDPWKLRFRQIQAMHILEALGPRAEPALPALTKVFFSENLLLVRNARCALQQIGPSAAPVFAQMLTNQHSSYRYEGAEGLAVLGKNGLPALPAIRSALFEALDRSVVESSIRAAVAMGEPGLKILIDCLDREKPTNKINLVAWIGKSGTNGQQALSQLQTLTQSTNVNLRNVATLAITSIQTGDSASLTPFLYDR